MIDLERELKTSIRTGKVILGTKRTLKILRNGRAKLIIVAKNTPEIIKQKIMYYAKLANFPIYEFPGTSLELGSLCGKPFSVAALAIIDEGESEILKLVEG